MRRVRVASASFAIALLLGTLAVTRASGASHQGERPNVLLITSEVRAELVMTADLLPTILNAVGLEKPENLPGRSLLPVLQSGKVPWREYIFGEYNAATPDIYFPQRAIRDSRYKLIVNLVHDRPNPIEHYYTFGHGRSRHYGASQDEIDAARPEVRRAYATWRDAPPVELYDLAEDPHEFDNLAGNPKYAKIRRRLEDALLKWRTETNDPLLDSKKLQLLTSEMDVARGNSEPGYRKDPSFRWQYSTYLRTRESGRAASPTDATETRPTVRPRPAGEQPVFSFGLFADVQYGDKPDRAARHYTTSLVRLRQCVAALNRHSLNFTIQLGDVIDGNSSVEKTREDLNRVVAEFAPLHSKLYHVVGNHCLNVGRKALYEKLGIDRPYYDFVPEGVAGWRMVVLDGNDAGYGVLGKEQIRWLRATLDKATKDGERVVIFNHFPLLKAAAPRHRMKKTEPLRTIINQSGCVVAYFAGHEHRGGYTKNGGIHHVTVQGMIEAPDSNAYAIVEVFVDRIKIHGFGKVPSRNLPIKNRAMSQPPRPKPQARGKQDAKNRAMSPTSLSLALPLPELMLGRFGRGWFSP